MTDDESTLSSPLHQALRAGAEARLVLAKELRLMADGGEDYEELSHASVWIKSLWRAAADMLEGKEFED